MTISHVLGPTKLTYDIMDTDACYEAGGPLLDSKILLNDFIFFLHRLVLLPRDSRHSAGVRHRRAVCPRRSIHHQQESGGGNAGGQKSHLCIVMSLPD